MRMVHVGETFRDRPTMDYETTRNLVLRHEGHRVRATYPNGYARSGIVGRYVFKGHEDDPCVVFDETIVMGELGGAVRVEVMVKGRYQEVATP